VRPVHAAILAAALLSGLDAVTTYIIIAARIGMEANPLLQFFNHAPAAVFAVQALSILMLALMLKLFEAYAGRLPPAHRARVWKAFYASFAAAVAWRAAVVLNNAMGIAWGVTPLTEIFVGSA